MNMTTKALRLQHGNLPPSRGIHHLALNTDDMKMTIDFYTGVLGMPLVHALKVPPGVGIGPGNRGNPPFENLRHYFFDAGGDTMVAFFEMPKGEKQIGDRNALAAMQHCSFTVTERRFHEMVARLEAAQVPLIGPVDVGAGTFSVYFFDPNGIRLEYSYQVGDGDDVRVVERWTQSGDEALQELRTLSNDPDWLAKVTQHLPRQRPEI